MLQTVCYGLTRKEIAREIFKFGVKSCNRKRKSELIGGTLSKTAGKFSVKSQRAIFSSHSIVRTRRVKMSDKISDKPVENIPKISDRIVENHKIITVEHELHIKGQVF